MPTKITFASRPAAWRVVTPFYLLFLFALLLLGLGFGLLTSGCTPAAAYSAKAAPAKIGQAVARVETPAAVQIETQIAVSEYLQRAVKPAKQAADAALFSFVADTFQSFDGATIPTVTDVEARVQSRTGAITDPDFPAIVAVGLDAWTLGRQLIPSNATTATVKSYLDAVATGTKAGASRYLSQIGEAP